MLGRKSMIRREPPGVVAAIVPWNVPQAISFLKLGPGARRGQHRGAQAGTGDRA
jgi:aldehyde dehydrogenase (NAD+)